MLQLLDFNENPNLGVFCRVSDDLGFVCRGLSKKVKGRLVSVLGVDLVELCFADATIIGSLMAINY